MAMHVQYVSIGLNVGSSEPEGQEAATRDVLALLHNGPGQVETVTHLGEWQGVQERTIQARVVTDSGAQFGSVLCFYARLLQQDAIAYTSPDCSEWMLAHASNAITRGASIAEFAVLFTEEQTFEIDEAPAATLRRE